MSLCQNPQLFHSVWFQWGWAKCSWESQELTGKWEHWGRRLQGQGSLNRQGVGAWAPVILAFVHVKTGKFRCLYNKEPRYHRKRAIKKKKWLYHCFQTLALKKKRLYQCFQTFQWSTKLTGPTHLEVVAPPINSGIFIANLSISLATKIISSREGVISPDRPIISIILKRKKKKEQWEGG